MMEGKKELLYSARAGFAEKNDVLAAVSPGEPGSGIAVELSSPVKAQYGAHIEKLAVSVVLAAGYDDVCVKLTDKGAWDYTIKARILAALERGMKND